MDWKEYFRKVDAQIEEAKKKRPPYTGPERRGISRVLAALVNAEGCAGDCEQGRKPCNCKN